MISKILSEYTFLYSNHSSVTRDKFNEDLSLDLLETFFLEGHPTLNYDDLWHIVSLLSISNNPFVTSDQNVLVKTRLQFCEHIINHLFIHPSETKLIVKTPAWQEILCTFFCTRKREKSGDKSPLVIKPEIIISSTSYLDNTNNNSDLERNDELLSKNNELLNKEDKSESTSLESHLSPVARKEKKIHSTLLKNKTPKNIQIDVDTNGASKRLDISGSDSDSLDDSVCPISPVQKSRDCQLNENNEIEDEHVEQSEGKVDTGDALANELFEKLMFLVGKLIWDGIVGSNEEAWKVIKIHKQPIE